MTCIIGLVHEGEVYIGADSAAVSSWIVQPTALRKVFRVGDFLIGYAGSFRMGQILQHHLEVPHQQDGVSDERYMVVEFVEAVRNCLKEKGYTKIEENRESGAYVLVGYHGQLYEVDEDFQIQRFLQGLTALGIGREFALGAMAALEFMPPMERITKALAISAGFSGAVCAPFIVERL